MRVLRWIEALSGILAGVPGGAAISYLLLAPTYNSENCHIATPGEPPICVTSTATLPQVNGITAIVDLSIVAALLLGLAVPAVWHSRTGRHGAQWTLWGSTAALASFTLLAILSIGALLLPSVALAIVASLCALVWPLTRNHSATSVPPRHL